MLSSLTVRNFRVYWLGMFVSLIGTWVQQVAQSWLVFQLTNSVFLLGLVGFLASLPIFFLALFGGVAADRLNKRNILIVTQTAFMVLAFILAALTQFKVVTPGHIMVIALLNGIIMAFDAPSRQAVVVELVGKQHLMNAIALNSVSFNSSRMIGPAIAGILVASIGVSGCFYANGVSFLAVIVALFTISLRVPDTKIKKESVLKDLKDGLRFMRQNRIIMALVTIVGISSLFGISYATLMPVFANDILKVGVKGFGMLMSSSGVGALISALILARLGDFKYKGRLLVASSFIFALSLICFSLSTNYFLSLLILIFTGASSVMAMALINTLLQTIVSDHMRGRVMSVFMFTFAGLMPFGNLLSGALSQWIGVSLTVLICGIICFLFFAVINLALPKLKSI